MCACAADGGIAGDSVRGAPARPPSGQSTSERLDVHVRLTPDWLLHETLCFDGPHTRVVPEVRAALPYCVSATEVATGAALGCGADGVDVAAVQTGCVEVVIDLRAAARALDDDALARVAGDVLVGSPDVWLWRPEPWPAGLVARMTLEVPDDIEVSVPFARAADGSYRVPRSTWRLASRAAFGRLGQRVLEVADARFTVSHLGRFNTPHESVDAWLSGAARAVATVSGRFPQPAVQVLLAPVPAASGVVFGMITRGGGPSAVLLVGRDAARADLVGEWVGVHELSHLLLPALEPSASWIGEGVASYYQEVLRGRVGLLDEGRAWQGLVDGFARGRARAGATSLVDASASMRETFAYQHVYWGGAALMLLLDVTLRQRGSSLDAAVAQVRALHPHDDQIMRASAWLDALGAASTPAGGEAFPVRSFVDERAAAPFVDTAATLRALGVAQDARGRVTLDDSAPLAPIRRAIAGPRAALVSRPAPAPGVH